MFLYLFSKFYEKQLELITSIEAILVPKTESEINQRMSNQQQQKYAIRILIITNLIINIVCSVFFN
jgi:hypothetical protein